jgi:putative membrane protein
MGNTMQIVRTILWVLLFVVILTFTFGNWDKAAEVRIWFGFVWNTKIPAVVIVSFLLGIVPTWLLHLGTKWRLTRRIKTLEAAARIPQVAPVQASPSETLEPAEPAPSSSTYSPNNPL